MCLICAWAIGPTIIPSRMTSAKFFLFIVPPFSTVHAKLLRDSETDMTAHRHERRTCGMHNIPIHSEPNMHSRTHADVGRDSRQQSVAAAALLSNSCDAFVLAANSGLSKPASAAS